MGVIWVMRVLGWIQLVQLAGRVVLIYAVTITSLTAVVVVSIIHISYLVVSKV